MLADCGFSRRAVELPARTGYCGCGFQSVPPGVSALGYVEVISRDNKCLAADSSANSSKASLPSRNPSVGLVLRSRRLAWPVDTMRCANRPRFAEQGSEFLVAAGDGRQVVEQVGGHGNQGR